MPVTFSPHVRLVASGVIGDGSDMFSIGVALSDNTLAPTALPGSAITDKWRDDTVALFSNFTTPGPVMSSHVTLKKITIAAIDEDGHYAAPPVESTHSQAGGQTTGKRYPWQVSLAATLKTAGDLGRVKGRIYVPMPWVNHDPMTDLIPAADAEAVRDGVAAWCTALGDAPGTDTEGWRVVVASQGRHNSDGSVRLAPFNHDVIAVNVGRRLDIIRRRANKVLENRGADAVVTF